jgi:hypothetical protein
MVYRPLVADSHHIDEELDPDPFPLLSKKLDRICIKVKSWIRIHIYMMLIRNPAYEYHTR